MVETLVQRVNRERFRFERGNSSIGLNLRGSQDKATSPGTELGHTANLSNAPQDNSQGLTRSLDTGLDNFNNLSPISPGPSPPSPVLAFSDPYPYQNCKRKTLGSWFLGVLQHQLFQGKGLEWNLEDWEGTLGKDFSMVSTPKKVHLNS